MILFGLDNQYHYYLYFFSHYFDLRLIETFASEAPLFFLLHAKSTVFLQSETEIVITSKRLKVET